MKSFERQYLKLMRKILKVGTIKDTRNSKTKSVFGEVIKIAKEDGVPLLQTRRIYYSGVLGEVAAFMTGPKNVKDFVDKGCNYWKLWSDKKNGNLRLSYGNEWINWGASANNPTGINQFLEVVELAKANKYDRRMIVTGWNPQAVKYGKLSLPCCHHTYQWNINTVDGVDYLDMSYSMRSNDVAIGLPSNMFMAYIMNVLMKNMLCQNGVDVRLGDITIFIGDAHLYEDHWVMAKKQSSILNELKYLMVDDSIKISYNYGFDMSDMFNFNPKHILIENYEPKTVIKYKLYK